MAAACSLAEPVSGFRRGHSSGTVLARWMREPSQQVFPVLACAPHPHSSSRSEQKAWENCSLRNKRRGCTIRHAEPFLRQISGFENYDWQYRRTLHTHSSRSAPEGFEGCHAHNETTWFPILVDWCLTHHTRRTSCRLGRRGGFNDRTIVCFHYFCVKLLRLWIWDVYEVIRPWYPDWDVLVSRW